MRFLGSASVFPHAQGMFREQFVMAERQCYPSKAMSRWRARIRGAAGGGAARRESRRRAPWQVVLITGAGTIGCLTVIAARLAGAARITVSDVLDRPLAQAGRVGADAVVHAVRDADA